MFNSVDFSKMPANYTFCYISECPQKDQCLRYLAASHQQVKKSQILVVNPSLYTGKGCRFFKDSTPIMVAYGMKDSFLDVSAVHHTAIHKELYDEFGRSSFFHFRDGSRPIYPEDQQIIRKIFDQYGYEVSFDRMEEESRWL